MRRTKEVLRLKSKTYVLSCSIAMKLSLRRTLVLNNCYQLNKE